MKLQRVSLDLELDQKNKLKMLAVRSNRTMADILREIVERYLKEERSRKKARAKGEA